MGLKNKKGFFFVLLTIFILSMFILSYTFYSNVQERKAVQSRVASMNNFIFSLEEDLSRNLYVFGFRTLFLVEDKIVSSGNYVSNLDSIFLEAFDNATFFGVENSLLLDANEDYFLANAQNRGEKINVNVNMKTNSLEITQDDPWNVKLVWNVTMGVSDVGELARWNFSEEIISYIPIENFEDPLYFVETKGAVSKKINRSYYSPLYLAGGSTSNLSNYLTRGQYLASNFSPSFLDRLEGIDSADEFGIESFVYLPDLSKQGISVSEKSIIDYVYFSNDNPVPLCTVAGMPTWFKVDSTNSARYNFTC